MGATYAGDPRYNARAAQLAVAGIRGQKRAFQQQVPGPRARHRRRRSQRGQDRLSYDIFTLNRESELEELKFPDHLLPINQFYNIANQFAQLGSGTSAQPFETVKDYDDWLKRAARIPVIFDRPSSTCAKA